MDTDLVISTQLWALLSVIPEAPRRARMQKLLEGTGYTRLLSPKGEVLLDLSA